MPTFASTRRGALLAGLGALAAPLAARAAASAGGDLMLTPPAAVPAPTDPAVIAYLARVQAQQQATIDQLIQVNSRDLYNDSGTAWIGAANGDVTIVEFFDYNCPYSMNVESRVQALLKADPGVRLVLKQFPIEDDARSPPAAKAALAALKQGRDRFMAFHQGMLAFHARFLSDQDIDDRAEKAGLDLAALHREMADPKYADQLIHNMNLARALRVFTTPTFIIDGHVVETPSAQIDFPAVVAGVRARRRGT